jgi:NTP pyrophosphatase (non-canonical NTP hydrolase)
VDEHGKCKETIKQICEGTGYSHTEVINTLKELDEMGYLSIQKDNKGNTYTPEFVARGDKKPTEAVVKKVESTPVYQVESSPAIENSIPSIKRVKRVNEKKGDLVDGLLFYAGQAKEQGEDKVEEVIQELERGLRVNIARSLNNQQVAKRILNDGRPLEAWLSWCKSEVWRAAHLYLYADLEKVWRDFPQAFDSTDGHNPQGLEIGT